MIANFGTEGENLEEKENIADTHNKTNDRQENKMIARESKRVKKKLSKYSTVEISDLARMDFWSRAKPFLMSQARIRAELGKNHAS